MNHNEIIRKTEDFLDTLPIESYISSGVDLGEVMNKIEDDYGDLLVNDPFFDGYVFNLMDTYEFSEYLKKRGYNIREELIVRYSIF